MFFSSSWERVHVRAQRYRLARVGALAAQAGDDPGAGEAAVDLQAHSGEQAGHDIRRAVLLERNLGVGV